MIITSVERFEDVGYIVYECGALRNYTHILCFYVSNS